MYANNQELRTAALANMELLSAALMSGDKQSFLDLQVKREAFYSVCELMNPKHHYMWYDRFDYEDAYRCRYCLKPKPESVPDPE